MISVPTCTAPGCTTALDRRGRNVSGLCRRHALDLAWTPEARAKAAASFRAWARANQLAWCPPGYRDAYRHLTNSKGLPAAEARAVVERQIETDARRYAATGVPQQHERTERMEA